MTSRILPVVLVFALVSVCSADQFNPRNSFEASYYIKKYTTIVEKWPRPQPVSVEYVVSQYDEDEEALRISKVLEEIVESWDDNNVNVNSIRSMNRLRAVHAAKHINYLRANSFPKDEWLPRLKYYVDHELIPRKYLKELK